MEEIDSTAIDYSEGGYVENKRIKGLVHVHDFRYSQAVFRNCIFENDIIFFSNSDKKKIHFSFTFCTIKRIIIDCFVDYISIEDCKINVIKQSEKGETYFIEIFSDNDKKNSLENFTILNSNTNRLLIRNYIINTLYFRGLNISETFDILNIEIQKFHLINSKIKIGSIIKVKSYDDFCLKDFQSDTDIYMDTLECKEIRIYSELRNVNLILNNVTSKTLRFQNLEVINSTFKMDTVKIFETLYLLNSDFNNSFFVDCDFKKCKIEISFPIIRNINSLNVTFSDDVVYYFQLRNATKEKQVSELIEFYRQLKINAILQHNQFDSLYYYAKEMNYYFKSLKNLRELSEILAFRNKKIKNVIIWLFQWIYDFYDLAIYSIFKRKNSFESFRIWLFKYTNNFGLKWFRPSMIYIVISYILFVIANDSYEFTNVLKFDAFIDSNFLHFLNPINKLSFFEITGKNTFKSSLIELLAIIIQGFLIYQIIRGFRKYTLKT